MHVCSDACVVPNDRPVGEFYVVIKKQFFGGYESIEEGSKFKASIASDLSCCPIHL